jgi:hypothetical protein
MRGFPIPVPTKKNVKIIEHNIDIISYRSITAEKKNISPEMRFNNETIRTFNQEVPPRSVNILQLIENDGDEKSPSVARLFQYQLHIFNEKT